MAAISPHRRESPFSLTEKCFNFVKGALNNSPIQVRLDIESDLLTLIQFKGVLQDEGVQQSYWDHFTYLTSRLEDRVKKVEEFERARTIDQLRSMISRSTDYTASLFDRDTDTLHEKY